MAARTGRELPGDFDFCQPDRQTELLQRDLYLSTQGETRPLPQDRQNHTARGTQVVVPLPAREAATPAVQTPFVIELTATVPGSSDQKAIAQSLSRAPTSDVQATAPVAQAAPRQDSITPPAPPASTLGCPGFQTFAHRGSAEQPENSIPAVVHALQSGHNGVEIDAQQLKDGRWVVHHDLVPGRVSQGSALPLAAMNSHQWRKIRLVDKQGVSTDTQAPFLDDLLLEFQKHASAAQYLNIEIKSGTQPYSCAILANLDRRVRSLVSQAQFMYSSRTMEHLRCLRSVNQNVYLGLVVDPHPDSIEIDPSSTTGRIAGWYDQISQKPASAQAYKANNNRRLYLTRTAFNDINSLIGPYYGFHIDYRDYGSFAPNYTNTSGKLMLYQLNDDQGLAALLKHIREKRQKLPDAILTDASRDFYCGGRG